MMKRTYLNSKEKAEARKIIQEKTGYTIKSTLVLNQIFRRSSFAAETGQNSNEIFEYIGDQILDFYVVKIVSERCGSLSLTDGYAFRIKENQFTQIKQTLVANKALAKIIDSWDIVKYLFLSISDIKNEVAKEPKIKADLLEAIIGAIAVDCKWDSEVLESVVSKVLNIDETIKSMIENDARVIKFDIDSAVTALKEMAENGQCTMPEYEFTSPADYDEEGNPIWACSCMIKTTETVLTRVVFSTSKKDSKKAAAYLILCEHLRTQNKYGPNDYTPIWTYKDDKLIPNRPDTKEK